MKRYVFYRADGTVCGDAWCGLESTAESICEANSFEGMIELGPTIEIRSGARVENGQFINGPTN